MILGIDFRGGSLHALVADERGSVAARLSSAAGQETVDVPAVCALGKAHGVQRAGAAVYDAGDPLPHGFMERFTAEFPALAGVRVIARGTAIALAEQWCGAAAGSRHVAALTLGESVHAGLVLDGRPFEGGHGFAGAVSWMSLNPVQREDYRRFGALEAEVGSAGIVKRLIWRVKAGDDSRVVEAVNGDLPAITVAHVFEHARSGDAVAGSVVRDTARYVGMAIANVVTVVDPDIVVLGGLIADAADLLLDQSSREAARRLPETIAAALKVVPSALGDDAAPLGAVRAALLSP